MKQGIKRAMVHGQRRNKRMSPHAHLDLLISYSLVLEMGSTLLKLMIQEKNITIGRSKGDWTPKK